MNPDCNILNPLQRDGTSQEKRLVRALHPSYVLVDEREVSDLLLYAKDYAKLIRFFSLENNPSGDWRKFIESDVSTLVSIIAEDTLDAETEAFDLARRQTASELNDFYRLLPPTLTLIEKAYRWQSQAIPNLRLSAELDKLTQSILNDILRNSVSYALRLEELGEAVPAEILAPSFLAAGHPVLENIAADQSLFPTGDLTSEEHALDAIDRCKREFQNTYESILSIIKLAPELLNETIEQYPRHSPQMALFLAFLLLFKIARQHLNTITQRHLDFYYQDVLQLGLQPEKPDEVHLVFQLAKNFDTHLLEKDVLFRAGKDANNANVFYGADHEIVVNKTQLVEEGALKTVFLDKDYHGAKLPDEKTAYTIRNIYAAPKANSADGLGADLEEEDGKWGTLGSSQMPYAKVGFAISSPIFLLREATRTITLAFHWKAVPTAYGDGNDLNNVIAHELRHNLKVYYTGEKDWVETAASHVDIDTNANTIIFTLDLKADAPAFVAHNAAVHQPGLRTSRPTLKFILDNEGLSASYLCFAPSYIYNSKQAAASIPGYIQQQMVEFINNNLDTPLKDINQYFADRITIPADDRKIVFKNAPSTYKPGLFELQLPKGREEFKEEKRLNNGLLRVTKVGEIFANRNISEQQFNDLYFSFCLLSLQEYNITALKQKGTPYLEGKNYAKGDIVIYGQQWFLAATDSPKTPPSPGTGQWHSLGVSFSYPYRYLQPLELTSLVLSVKVDGMRDLVLENDLGGINPAKPFQPFGPLPKIGSKFYIGNDEVFQKALDYLQLDLTWADLPKESFNAYYNEYRDDANLDGVLDGSSPIANNQVFTAAIELLYKGKWATGSSSPLNEFSFALFGSDINTDNPNPARFEQIDFREASMERMIDLRPFSQLSPSLLRGFIRLTLQSSFLHKDYPKWIARAAIQTKPQWTPNEPYTPTISTFVLNYKSTEHIAFDGIPFDQRIEQLFHLTPFGWNEFYPIDYKVDPQEAIVSPRIVPEFRVSKVVDVDKTAKVNDIDAEGTLYIGLTELEPEQNVSILFQVAEGSADPELRKQQVIWSYLANNRWVDFEKTQVLSDTTNGLLTSGIVTFVMPKAMTKDNTLLLGKDTYWIKGAVAQQTDAISKAIAVLPQAVKASFRKEAGNDLSRLANPLPADTISKLVERRAALKKIEQPFASFNGHLREQNVTPPGITGDDRFKRAYNEFYIRVSERLRHKNRAITIFDYERLILQNFPDIYKAKCLNHTSIGSDVIPASEHAPGHVKVIVLPNLRNRNAVDPLQPKVSLNQLEEIRNLLNPLKSDFVTLEVRNPLFEKVNVSFKVKFLPGKDKGFYTKKLREDIVRFLSPWLYDEGADLQLGGSIHRSVILNKIEETDYVDYVTDFTMNHIIGNEERKDVEAAVATTSSSVIVSDLAEKHTINEVDIKCLSPTSIS